MIYRKKTYRKEEFLPKKLITKITEVIFNNNEYEYRTKNNFLKCIGIIYHKQIHKSHSLEHYVPTGRDYWRKVFSGDYHKKVIMPLIDLDIIQSKDFGYRNVFVGIRYRINPELINDDCEVIPYIQKGKVISAEESMYSDGLEFFIEEINDKNFHLSIDHKKAISYLENSVEKICNEYLHPDYVSFLADKLYIEYREALNEGSYNTRYSTVEFAKICAETFNKQLFYYKDNFYIGNINDFITQRIPAQKHHYKMEIAKIGLLPIINKRNPVNLRLHNFLVTFPSKILQFIKINNQTIVQFDLRTSQFLLFANLLNVFITEGEFYLLSLFKHQKTLNYVKRFIRVLKKHEKLLPKVGVDINNNNSGQNSSSDIIKFIRDVFTKDFYSVVQVELGLPSRGLAKQVLFKLLFKKTNRRDILVDKLKEQYPIVMSIIAGFKQQVRNQSKESKSVNDDDRESYFSVFLQCIEAEIFIDNILIPLRDKGIPCFTRHDSIVVADGYQDEVETFVKNVFARFGFKYNHKVEDKFWEIVDYDDLDDSPYLDWLIGENEMNTESSIEEQEDSEENILIEDNMEETYDLEEHHFETIERLQRIGLRKDYFKSVDVSFLEDISELPFLNDEQRDIILDDAMNLSVGYNYLQDKTNNVLQYLTIKIEDIAISDDDDE